MPQGGACAYASLIAFLLNGFNKTNCGLFGSGFIEVNMHNTIAGVKVFVKKHSTTSRSSPAAAKIGKTTKSATTSKKLLIQKHPKGRADSDANPRRLHRSSASLNPALKQATAQRHKIKIGTVDKKRRFSGQGKSKVRSSNMLWLDAS
jgi:hypothetical protein